MSLSVVVVFRDQKRLHRLRDHLAGLTPPPDTLLAIGAGERIRPAWSGSIPPFHDSAVNGEWPAG